MKINIFVLSFLFPIFCLGQTINGIPGQGFAGQIAVQQLNGVYSPIGFPSSCTVSGNTYTTPLDCAFATAWAAAQTLGVTQSLSIPAGTWNTCSGINENSTYVGQPLVNIYGAGDGISNIQQTCSNSNPTINIGRNFGFKITNITINANYLAPAAFVAQYGANLTMQHVIVKGAIMGTPSSPGLYEMALLGTGFQATLDDVQATGFQPNGTAPNITVNVSGGQISSFTIVNGGTNLSSTITPVFYYLGTQNGVATQPCTTMPTNQPTYTISGGVFTSVGLVDSTTASVGSGCVGPIYLYPYDADTIQYGIELTWSDSTYNNLWPSVGEIGIYIPSGGSGTFDHAHPYDIPIGIDSYVSNTWKATEFDSLSVAGVIEGGSSPVGDDFADSQWYQDTKQTYYGSIGYWIQNANATTDIHDGSCHQAFATGYNMIMGNTAPVVLSEYYSFPYYINISNEQECVNNYPRVTQVSQSGQQNGTGVFGRASFGNRSIASQNLMYLYSQYNDLELISNTNASPSTWTWTPARGNNFSMIFGTVSATSSSGNISSSLSGWSGSYYNGTSPSTDQFYLQDILGTGTNPTATLTLGHTGASGGIGFSFGTIPVVSALTFTATGSSGFNFSAPLFTPSTSSSTCTTGQVEWDSNYIYVCTATNTIRRVSLTSF